MPKKKDENKTHRTQQIQIKKGHKLYDYFTEMTEKEKNLRNAVNFVIRQIYTSLTSFKPLHKLQSEMMDLIHKTLPSMNEVRMKSYKKEVARKEKAGEDTSKVKPKLLDMPKASNWINYGILDLFLKASKNPDYLALSAQTAQACIKTVVASWKSFFKANEKYNASPAGFTGRPKPPQYAKESKKTVKFSNQDAVILDNKYLKLPKTKIRLNIGKLGFLKHGEKLMEVRCVPYADIFIVELVFEVEKPKVIPTDNDVIMSVDFGVDNFMTCVFSDGSRPIIFNGKHLKSINQHYNKQKARYTHMLRVKKQSTEGAFNSKCLYKFDVKRKNKMRDAFHKISKALIGIAVEHSVKTIVFGKNDGWKTAPNMQKKTKQHFVQIGHSQFLQQFVKYKAESEGIEIIEQEESYTSKASCVDLDDIPVFGDKHIPQTFSGRRIKRGLYRSANGTLINADVNGAYNILRKAVPRYYEGIEVAVNQPLKLCIG